MPSWTISFFLQIKLGQLDRMSHDYWDKVLGEIGDISSIHIFVTSHFTKRFSCAVVTTQITKKKVYEH